MPAAQPVSMQKAPPSAESADRQASQAAARDCRRGFTCYADVTLDSRGLPALRDHITGEGRPAFLSAAPHGAGSRPGKPGKEKNRK
jgi:hypothetical protein